MPTSAEKPDQASDLNETLERIQGLVADALEEMFVRAEKERDVTDDKPASKGDKKGLVQDCEFGMILLHGCKWLEKRNALPEALQDTPDKKGRLKAFIVKLLGDTVSRLLSPKKNKDEGGELGANAVFFTGEPYSRNHKAGFSAHLDSAMLVVAFLAPAVARYRDDLAKPVANLKKLPDWAKTMRDAALAVCKEAIEYALECRVFVPEGSDAGVFAGFTSDPTSRLKENNEPCLSDEDRLFFSWTACESIFDLVSWRNDYLKGIQNELPSEVYSQIWNGIESLSKTIPEMSQWCFNTFDKKFFGKKKKAEALKGVDVKASVQALKPTGDDTLEGALKKGSSALRCKSVLSGAFSSSGLSIH